MSTVDAVSSGYLWRSASNPAVAALRARAWALLGLGPGARVLDMGCGPGTTFAGLAMLVGPYGRIAAVDHDPAMVREAETVAHRLGIAAMVRCQVADATALPFPDGSFDAFHCERVLQHLEPDAAAAAIAEAARVLRPGGVAAFIDSDWASLSVDAADPVLERRLLARHLDRFRNPFGARGLGRAMREAGFGLVASEPHAIPLSGIAATDLLEGAERDAFEAGEHDEAARARWQDMVRSLRQATLPVGHLTMILAVGRRA